MRCPRDGSTTHCLCHTISCTKTGNTYASRHVRDSSKIHKTPLMKKLVLFG